MWKSRCRAIGGDDTLCDMLIKVTQASTGEASTRSIPTHESSREALSNDRDSVSQVARTLVLHHSTLQKAFQRPNRWRALMRSTGQS